MLDKENIYRIVEHKSKEDFERDLNRLVDEGYTVQTFCFDAEGKYTALLVNTTALMQKITEASMDIIGKMGM